MRRSRKRIFNAQMCKRMVDAVVQIEQVPTGFIQLMDDIGHLADDLDFLDWLDMM